MSLSDKDIESAFFARLLTAISPSADEIVALSGASRLSQARIDKITTRIQERATRLSGPFVKNIERRAAKSE